MPRSPSLPLPRGWSKLVRTGVLHAISVAAAALTHAWSRAASSRSSRTRERSEADGPRFLFGAGLLRRSSFRRLKEAFLRTNEGSAPSGFGGYPRVLELRGAL